MDQHTPKLQSKITKMEASLMDLTNEILTAVKFLFQLKENSTDIVKNLNGITAPETYLKEFMNVNYYISKYLNFLTEVNCKFEMLEISEKDCNISKPIGHYKSEARSENKSKANLSLNFYEDSETLKKLNGEEPLDMNLILPNNDKTNNIKRHSSDENLHSFNENLINYSGTGSSQVIYLSEKMFSSDKVDDKQMILKPNSNGTRHHMKKTLGELESSFTSSNTSSFEEKQMHKSFKKASSPILINSGNNSPLCKAQCNDIWSRDNLEAEYVSTETNNSNIKVSNCVQDSDSESYVGTQQAKLKENATKKNDIKPLNLIRKLGEEYDVVIENIKSPSEFYVFIKNSETNLLFELESKLKLIPKVKNKCSKRHQNRKTAVSKEFGNYVLYYSKCDEMWYRAEITNWCLNFKDDFVTVFLLDSGESKCVSIDDLEPMPEFLKRYPAFAQRCHLHGIFPLDMDLNSDTIFWEKGSTEKMRSLTEGSDKVRIRIAADDCFHSATSLPVTLWLVDQANQCVNQLLVESKYAIQLSALHEDLQNTNDKNCCTGQDENLNNWNPMKEDFESFKNNYELDISDPAAVIYGYIGKDHKRICSHFAKTGYCFKGEACKKEHQKLDPLGFTTDQEEIYNNAFSILSVPPPKAVINVQITCLLTFNKFCCIPADCFYSGEESLQSLVKFMNKAENLIEMRKLLVPPSAGQIVIAQYSEDGSWYRARILESQPEKDVYTVLFVDYGNKEILSLSNIRAIEARYLHLPFQGMLCYIFGVDRNPKVPLKVVMNYVNERVHSGHITIEIVSKLPGEGTNLLVHVFDNNGRNIGDELIAEEYAICKPEILVSNNSESIPG